MTSSRASFDFFLRAEARRRKPMIAAMSPRFAGIQGARTMSGWLDRFWMLNVRFVERGARQKGAHRVRRTLLQRHRDRQIDRELADVRPA